MEIWKKIPGLDVTYEASNTGKIQRQYRSKDKLLTGYHKRGKKVVKVKRQGKMVETSWSKLVWSAFNGPIPEGGYVRRKNCRLGYELDNLILLSNKQNGKMFGGLQKKADIVVYESDQEQRFFISARSAGRYLHLSYQTVLDTINNKIKKPIYPLRKATFEERQGIVGMVRQSRGINYIEE
ncbi:NUMOD4 domain-containing protein [Culicoidibacter larvae]|nr:NUMOD4 domain-containing protein [Culicoidibacter larvae]